MMPTKRLLYPDILRILASVLVVGVHVCASSMDALPLAGFDFFAANALDCLSILGVPLFVMLSGTLELSRDIPGGKDASGISLSHGQTEDMRRSAACARRDTASERAGAAYDAGAEIGRYVKKALFLMGLYFFWLACYNLLNCYYEGYGFSFDALKKHVLLESLLGRGIYHLWFLPMLAGLTLVTPLLKPAAKSRRLSAYFLLLYLIFTILMPTILKFQYRFPFYAVVEGLYSRIPYVVITGYTGYFLLGHHLAIHLIPLRRKWLPALFAGFFLSWTIGHLVCFYDSLRWGQPSVILNDPYSLTDFVAAACLFLFVKTLAVKPGDAPQTACSPASQATSEGAHSAVPGQDLPSASGLTSGCPSFSGHASDAACSAAPAQVSGAACSAIPAQASGAACSAIPAQAPDSACSAVPAQEPGFPMSDAGSESGKARKRIALISSCTLGIYLLHPALLMLSSHLGLSTLALPQILSIPLWVAVIWGLCLLITLLLKRIPGVRRLL